MKLERLSQCAFLLTVVAAAPAVAPPVFAQGSAATPSKEYIYVNGKLTTVEILATGQGPSLTITKTHIGNFTQGQTGAVYTVVVTNGSNAGPTKGTVTVAETVPAGLMLVSMAGNGWTCPNGSTSCTRSDVLNFGSSYSPLTVTVNVAANAPSQLTNQVSVSGGGSPVGSASDITNIGSSIGMGCSASLSPTAIIAAPGGLASSALVTISGGCGWSASSNASWLTINSISNGTVSYTATPNTSGAQRVGTLTLAGQTFTVTQAAYNASQFPSLVSLSPFQGSGANANLTFVYSDPNGWAAIQSAEFIINPRWEPGSRAGGCYVKYAPGTGVFTLIANDGNSVAGTAAPGTQNTMSNSQCTLNAVTSSVSGSGNNLTIVASLTFQPSFTGQRHIWMQAVDYNNNTTNWLVYGVWFPTQTTFSTGPWYRIYDPNSNSFLYSSDQNEYNTLGAQGFTLQGTSGLVMTGPMTVANVPNIAWYRVYVNSTSSHFWTSDRNEFLTLVNLQQAYVGEGVAAFVMPYINALGQVSPQVTNTIPFYRAAFQGKNLHFWTADADEYFGTNGEHLPTGYLGEGIASYIFPVSGAQFAPLAVPTTKADMANSDDSEPTVVSALNGASLVRSGVVSPGQVLAIYGRHLGGKVLLNGRTARVISRLENEIRVVVPNELIGSSEANLEVEANGHRTKPLNLGIVQADPAIFASNAYGRGNAEARNADGTTNDAQHPAAHGSLVTLYATGFSIGHGSLDLPVEVHVGGWPAKVISKQTSRTREGVIEVQIQLPDTVGAAPFQPVVLHVGNMFSQPGVGLAIQ